MPGFFDGSGHDCTLQGEEHYELELQRMNKGAYAKPENEQWTHIACSRDREHLMAVAQRIEVRDGVTFRESLKLELINEDGDIEAIEYCWDGEA